jgi:glycosyltransferase involved in cell wall biosynthesis
VSAYHKKLDELVKLGAEVHVIVPDAWGDLRLETREGNGYHLYPRKIHFNGKHHFHYYPGLKRLLQSIKPDVVHIDEEHYSIVTYQAMRIARSIGAKALFFTWQNIYKKYPFPFSRIERYNFRHAQAAIAGNREAKDVLRKKGFSKIIAEIPQFGVDPEVFKKRDSAEIRRGLGIKSEDFVLGFMGRLVEEKGIRTLLEALKNLPEKVRLLLIGNGPDETALVKMVGALGIEQKVLHINQVPSLEVPGYLNCMDCLVLPSLTKPNWKEQFGRVLIEAMACEVPVIGSSSGEIPEVIGEAGLIFPEGHGDELRRHIESLMRDGELRMELGRKGRERVLEKFTQRKIAEATYEVYRSI